MKVCCTCRLEKPLTEFNRRSAAADGRQRQCRSCSQLWYRDHAAVHKQRVAQRNARVRVARTARLLAYLVEHPCVDCGEADLRVLEFDHRDGARKTAEVTKLAADGVTWTAVLREIEKCDVRCANCHRARTWLTQPAWRRNAHDEARDGATQQAIARLRGLFPVPAQAAGR